VGRRWLRVGCLAGTVTIAVASDYADLRESMVRTQLVPRGIEDARVLAAMRKVPRHEFVPTAVVDRAYDDEPLPIGNDQTISQPYIVARMTELAAVRPSARVLEVGTGSGYQAALLAELATDVYSIEIVEPLAKRAAATLRRLGYDRIHLRQGDGYRGWPEAAPFDAILVTTAPRSVPAPLLKQLAPGGRLVIPVGGAAQVLEVHRRTADGIVVERDAAVAFVPMTGEAQRRRPGPAAR
jgi:protein-L-isoaspartate(D-aspartate) O-methyltransferase